MMSDYVAVTGIADRLGVNPNVVSNWRKRHWDFPKPHFVIARGQTPVFDWNDVQFWALAHWKLK